MQTSEHGGFRSLGKGSTGGLALTLLIHGGLLLLVYMGSVKAEPRQEAARDLIVTQLVKLGKPREKHLLPRITQPPKAQAPEPTIKVAQSPEAPPSPKEEPRPKEAERSKDLKRALDRARQLAAAVPEESDEGQLTGSADGTATTAQEGDAYATAVNDAIKRNWSAPAGLLNDAQLAKLEAEVRVGIGPNGELQAPKIAKSSGNALFDDSCIQAVTATGRVPPPPPALRNQFRRGMLLGFEGKNLAR